MPIKVSLTNGRGSRWTASQIFQSENIMQSTSRHASTSYGQTLYVGAGNRTRPSARQMGTKTRGKAKTSYTGRPTVPVPKTPAIQYHAAGQSWCGHSRKQRDILEHPSNQGRTQVKYMDCSKDGPNTQHPVCNLQARGFPYLARCDGSNCNIVKYGRHTVDDLNKHVATDMQQQKQ